MKSANHQMQKSASTCWLASTRVACRWQNIGGWPPIVRIRSNSHPQRTMHGRLVREQGLIWRTAMASAAVPMVEQVRSHEH